MVFGALSGFTLVVIVCDYGANFILAHDFAFKSFLILGALFLIYLAWKFLPFKSSIARKKRESIVIQGFISAV